MAEFLRDVPEWLLVGFAFVGLCDISYGMFLAVVARRWARKSWHRMDVPWRP